MTKRLLPVLLVAAVVAPASPALAQPPAAPSGRSIAATTVTSTPMAFARGFGSRSRGFGSRSRYRSPYGRSYRSPYRYRSRGIGHFFGNALKFLGVAYLFHAIFGWGAGGGSPFGLLIVLAFVVWLFTRSRRRRYYAQPY